LSNSFTILGSEGKFIIERLFFLDALFFIICISTSPIKALIWVNTEVEVRSTGESKSMAELRPDIPKKEEGEIGLGERGNEGGVIDLNFGMFSPFFSLNPPFSAESSSEKDGVKNENGERESVEVSRAMSREKERASERERERER